MEQTILGEKKKKNTTMAAVAYLIFFLPLLTDSKDDPFVKYHVKQGLLLFLVALVLSIFPFFSIIGAMINWLITVLIIVLVVMGIMNAVNGEEKPLPLIGQFAEKINL